MTARLVLLAVDDEAMILQTFARNFRTQFDLRFATGGAEALEIIEKDAPDILVSDYAMPGMNGIELLERATQLRPGMARFLATAHASAPEVLEAHAKSLCRLVIEKPWTRAVLLEAFESALRPTT